MNRNCDDVNVITRQKDHSKQQKPTLNSIIMAADMDDTEEITDLSNPDSMAKYKQAATIANGWIFWSILYFSLI